MGTWFCAATVIQRRVRALAGGSPLSGAPTAIALQLLKTIFTVAASHSLSAESRRAVLRQFIYYFFSYRQGRHPMVGGVWQNRRRDLMLVAISDEDVERPYLGRGRVSAILRGSERGLAIATDLALSSENNSP